MKRLFCLILPIILLATLIACAQQSGGAEDSTSETAGVADTGPSPDDTTAHNGDTEEHSTPVVSCTEPTDNTTADTTEEPSTSAPTVTEPVTSVHKHSYSLSSSVKATCTEKGKYIYSCACGSSYSEDIPIIPHNYTPASCIAPETCANCGHSIGGQLAHEVVDGVCSLCKKEVLCLGITEAELMELVGQPDRTISESTSVGEVTTYIYSSDIMKLRFYQLSGGKVSAIFSVGQGYIYCHMPTKKTHIPTAHDENMKLISDGNIDILCFTDITGSHKMSSSWAKLTEFNYGFNTMNAETDFKGETVIDYSTQAMLCLYITNYYRALNGLNPLEYSAEASAASLTHSLFMAHNSRFEHTDFDGNRASYRLRNEGIDGVYCGENIQAGYFHINNIKTVNIFFVSHSWYTSPSHREVMLTPEYKYMGAGFAYYPLDQYEYYSTQVFYRYP